jgi:outer membrane protein TolC
VTTTIRPPRTPLTFWIAIVAAMACLGAPSRAQEIGVAGTMPEDMLPGLNRLLDTALRQSPSMVATALQVAMADESRRISGVAPMLPSLGSGFGYGRSTQSLSNNSGANSGQSGFIYNAGISQPVFQWGALRYQLEITKTAQLIQQKNYAEAYRNLASTLRRQYLDLVQSKIDLRNKRFFLSDARAALTLADDNLKNGRIPPSTIAGYRMDVDERQLAVDRAEEVCRSTAQLMAHEAGAADFGEDAVPESVPAPKYAASAADYLLAGLLRDGARNTLQAQMDELQIRQSDLNYRIARVRLLPKFSASASMSQQTNTYATSTTVQQTLVTTRNYYLNANWSLFDGLATHWLKVQALDQKRYFERQLEIVTDSTMDQAENVRRTVDFSWRSLELASRRLEMAQGSLGYLEKEMRLGRASPDDVTSARGAVYSYDLSCAAARSDFFNTWSGFVSLVGADPAMNRLPNRYVRAIR